MKALCLEALERPVSLSIVRWPADQKVPQKCPKSLCVGGGGGWVVCGINLI